VLKPSGWYGDVQAFALLSFENLEEAYKVHLLRTQISEKAEPKPIRDLAG
jgi:hypothetical protein